MNEMDQSSIEALEQITADFRQAMTEFDQRLSRLEESAKSPETTQSSDESSDSQETLIARRRIYDQEKKHEPESLRSITHLCRSCKHSWMLNGADKLYSSSHNEPLFPPSGFIVCNVLKTSMNITSAPTDCMMYESDGGTN